MSLTRFRVWDSQHRHMLYPESDKAKNPYASYLTSSGDILSYAITHSGYLQRIFSGILVSTSIPIGEKLIPLFDTTLRAANPSGPEPIALYEGDIISFSIKRITHGPEREDIAAAHIWWCKEDGCWAFGYWLCPAHLINFPAYNWWYTMQDRIDRASIRLLGNVWENPELIPLLGYTPSL